MKITAILGSPRTKGNSAAVVDLLIDALQPAKPEVKRHELNKLNFKGCQACMACKTTSEACVVKDDLSRVFEDIKSSDVVVLTSPVYIGEVTAQAKGFIDRAYSLYKPDFRTNPNPGRVAAGKKFVFVLSQGNPDEKLYADIISRYSGTFSRVGFKEIYPIRAIGVGPQSDVKQNKAITGLVADTAAKLLAA
jgi:multimeric flavodoxin WrbA